MEKVIFKFKLIEEAEQEIELPFGNEFLKAGVQKYADINCQREDIVVWFLCNKLTTMVKRKVFIVPTGITFEDDSLVYLDSVLLSNGNLVFHIFIEKN